MVTLSRGLVVRPEVLKAHSGRVDTRSVLWLIALATVWLFFTIVALSLCVMARRGDDDLLALARPHVVEVPFVATLADPAPTAVAQPPVRPRAPSRSTR
jgi:hypothetical protein